MDKKELANTLATIYTDLVGVAEVAENLGVGIPLVKDWIFRRESVGCPKPIRSIRMGDLYSMTEWRGWYSVWLVTRSSKNWRTSKLKKPVGWSF